MKNMSGSGRVIVPYVGIERVVETLGAAYRKKVKEIGLEELTALLGCSISNINNVTPTLSLLNLATTKNRVMSITNDGLDFIKAYTSNETERAKNIIKKGIKNSESLIFAKSLLETRVQLSGEDIGRALSDRFNKRWKTVVTYRTYGNSCASILSFAGFGYYNNGVFSLKPLTSKSDTNFYAPEVGYKPIIRLLTALNPFEKVRVSEISPKLKAKEGRITKELAVCIILGLVEKDSTGSYGITENGRRLINPRLKTEEKSEIMQGSLLNSSYSQIIDALSDQDKELSYEDIGDILAYELRRDWAPLTKKIYGKKIITWLGAADLLDKTGPNSFKIKNWSIKQIDKDKKQEQSIINSKLYEIALNLGALELVIPNEKNRESFEDKITSLKLTLKEYSDLHLLLDLLKENFELSIENNNPNIYEKNYHFIASKVREKLKVN